MWKFNFLKNKSLKLSISVLFLFIFLLIIIFASGYGIAQNDSNGETLTFISLINVKNTSYSNGIIGGVREFIAGYFFAIFSIVFSLLSIVSSLFFLFSKTRKQEKISAIITISLMVWVILLIVLIPIVISICAINIHTIKADPLGIFAMLIFLICSFSILFLPSKWFILVPQIEINRLND